MTVHVEEDQDGAGTTPPPTPMFHPTTTQLNLDHPKNDTKRENHPRRLLPIPGGSVTTNVLVYGGNRGATRTLDTTTKDVSVHENSIQQQQYWDEDEDVRAIAISKDGTRVAVGLDSGSTILLTYGTVDILNSQKERQRHPFLMESHPNTTSATTAGAICKPISIETGPTFAAPVRDLQFHPQSLQWLAVATEEGFCMLHIPAPKNAQDDDDDDRNQPGDTIHTKFLHEEATQAHDGGGIRSVCFSPTGDVVASLGMDGRLCLWYTPMVPARANTTRGDVDTANTGRQEHWALLHRDTTRCVTKRDTGEILGADAWDRSCRPVFVSNHVMVLPGETYLQFRIIHSVSSSSSSTTTTTTNTPPASNFIVTEQTIDTKGHVESIVTFAICDDISNPHQKYVIASGRDKRLTLWSVTIPPSKQKSKVKHTSFL
jgi:WD40 repeat protein